MTLKQDIRTIFEVVDALRNIQGAVSPRSLLDASKAARVEPLCRISRDCLTLEYLEDVCQSALSLYTGAYLQAVSLSTTVNGVRVMKVLDKFNPDRGYSSPNFESYDDRSLNLDNYEWRLPLTMESDGIDYAGKKLKELEKDAKKYGLTGNNDGGTNASMSQKDYKEIFETSDMSVGKFINVDVCVGDRDFTIPVNVRLDTKAMNTDAIVSLLGANSEDKSLVERIYDYRSGKIGIMDLMFATDLIREHKKMLLTDKDGTYSEIVRRINNSKKYGTLSMNFSMADASNVFIISEDVAKIVELKLGGKLSNPIIREKMFNATYAMIVVVIHPMYERLTYYYNGISRHTEMSVKAIKRSSKNKGPDIGDILKAYQLGSAPSF